MLRKQSWFIPCFFFPPLVLIKWRNAPLCSPQSDDTTLCSTAALSDLRAVMVSHCYIAVGGGGENKIK